MTNEQAIELLYRISDSQFDGEYGDERREALSMAVRALEPNLGQKTIDCIIKRLNGEDTAQPTQTNADSTQSNTLDCVSRKMAIDAVADGLKGIFVEYRDIAEKMIGKLPSAQPTYTDEEIQKMQDLESAEIEKAYHLGYEEGKKDVQPEYNPVTAEDFAKTMSENTLYGFIVWHCEALVLMKEQGFVICKKTM